MPVSTHSRPKAAGLGIQLPLIPLVCFNTQPPEGGWGSSTPQQTRFKMFQHTAARRRLDRPDNPCCTLCSFNTQPPEGGWWSMQPRQNWVHYAVSTHSRPKAAGQHFANFSRQPDVSTHSRPKAAGLAHTASRYEWQGFNTQPPEGGWVHHTARLARLYGFNTQPPEGGWD